MIDIKTDKKDGEATVFEVKVAVTHSNPMEWLAFFDAVITSVYKYVRDPLLIHDLCWSLQESAAKARAGKWESDGDQNVADMFMDIMKHRGFISETSSPDATKTAESFDGR